jgi:hypothetical protein
MEKRREEVNALEGLPCSRGGSTGPVDAVATVIMWPYIFHATKFALVTLQLFSCEARSLFKVLAEVRKLRWYVLPSLFAITQASP